MPPRAHVFAIGTALLAACNLVNGLDDYTFDGSAGGAAGVGGMGGSGGVVSATLSVRVTGLSTELTASLGDEALVFTSDGTQAFTSPIALGTSYEVTFTDPAGESCTADNRMGTADADVEVSIHCTPTIRHLFPSATNWLDYVDRTSLSPCDATTAMRYDDCVHGAERLAVYVPGATDCTGVSGTDTPNDAFTWECDDSGSTVQLVSRGLQTERGLTDLIDSSRMGFEPLAIAITSPLGSVSTTPAVMWGNAFAEADASTTLDEAGTIYLVLDDPGQELQIAANKVAVVIDPATTITVSSGPALSAAGANFAWIEGSVTGRIELDNTAMAVLRNVAITGTLLAQTTHATMAHGLGITNGSPCIDARKNTGLAIENAALSRCAQAADFQDGTGGYLREVHAADCAAALRIRTSQDFALDRVMLANFTATALRVESTATRIHVTRLIAASTGMEAVRFECSECSLRGATAALSSTDGFLLGANNAWISDILAVNNGIAGIHAINLTAAGYNWTAMSQRGNGPVANLNVVDSALDLHGVLRGGGIQPADGANCKVTNSSGIEDGSCNAIDPSDYSVSANMANGLFLGKLAQDDSANSSDNSGEVQYTPNIDWTHFDRETRAWGFDGPFFPNVANQGTCSTTNTDCRIWDWALRADLSFVLKQNGVPKGDDTGMLGTQTFLLHAFELLGDGVGDDDTLCESDERCGVMRNGGGYQGHGPITQVPFEDGVMVNGVTGVTLYETANNGG